MTDLARVEASRVHRQGIKREVREDQIQPFARAVTLQNRGEDVTIVVHHRQVTRAFEDFAAQAGPFAEDASAFDAAAHHEHYAAATVIRAERRVLLDAATEFRHHHHRRVFHLRAEV